MKKYITGFFVMIASTILIQHGIYAAQLCEDTAYDVNYIYEGENVVAEFDAVNTTGVPQNAFVTLGVYNASGSLEDVSFKKINVKSNSVCKLTSATINAPSDGENLKLFAWDETLRPLETGSDLRTVRKNAFINEITVNGKKAIADNSINVITVNSSNELSDISVTDISLPQGAFFTLENDVLKVTSEDGKITAAYTFRTAPLTLLDFESDSPEQKPSGWSTGGNKDSSVKVSTSGDGKVMKIADNSTESAKASAIYQLPNAIEPPYTVTYKIKYERPPFESGLYDVSSCWFHLRDFANFTVMSACAADYGSYLDYKAKSANGEKSAGGKMQVEKWHEIKMTCVSETEANFYLDGKLIYTASPLNFVNLEKLSIFTTEARKCTMYIDDIAVYHDAYAGELKAAYEDIESQFSGVLGWIADLYEPHTGGFYTTVSGKNGAGYVPSLESTAFVYAMLGSSETGLVSTMPDEFKASLIEYFQNAQSDEDGFFYDYGVPRSSYGDRAKMRVYQQCINKLSALGAKPLYALPSERLAQTASLMVQTDAIILPSGFPGYLATVHGFMETVKSRNWDTSSWTAGDLTYEDTSYLVQLGEDVYAPYIEALFDWLRSRQDSETGYWAQSGSTNFNALSGAFKVVRIYDRFKTQPPNCDKICKSIIETLFSGEAPASACDIRNFLDILSIIQKYDADVVKNTLKGKELRIVNAYADYMKLFFKPDGGASNYQNASTASFGGIPAGAGKEEGDIDGTQQMFIARNYLHKLFGRKLDNSMFASQSENFWAQIMAKRPRNIMINFETYKTGVTPKSVNSSLWSLSDNEIDRTTLIAENDSGRFVCLTDNSETEKANCKTQNILMCTFPFKMSFDVCYELPEGVSKRDLVNDFSYSPFYVRSGGSLSLCGVQPVYKNGSFWFYYFENGAANTQSGTQIIPGEWYNVEMNCYFDTTDDKFYTDYTFTDSSGNSDTYFKIPSGVSEAKATTYYFSTSPGRKCRVSFDNLHIEEVSK